MKKTRRRLRCATPSTTSTTSTWPTSPRSGGGQVEEPGGHDATPPPDLGDVGQVEVVLVVLGVAQRSRLRVFFMRRVPETCVLQDVQTLAIRGHERVFDAVVNHLDEMARARRAAVEIAVLGCPAELLSSRRALDRAGPRR